LPVRAKGTILISDLNLWTQPRYTQTNNSSWSWDRWTRKNWAMPKVLTIGAGGLGSAILPYLAAANWETGIMDDDHIDVTNFATPSYL
jgi:hypothetical protein